MAVTERTKVNQFYCPECGTLRCMKEVAEDRCFDCEVAALHRPKFSRFGS